METFENHHPSEAYRWGETDLRLGLAGRNDGTDR